MERNYHQSSQPDAESPDSTNHEEEESIQSVSTPGIILSWQYIVKIQPFQIQIMISRTTLTRRSIIIISWRMWETLPRKYPSTASWENGDTQKMKATHCCHFLLHSHHCWSHLAAACWWSTLALMGSFILFVVIIDYLAMFKEFNEGMPMLILSKFVKHPLIIAFYNLSCVICSSHITAILQLFAIAPLLHWLLIAYNCFQHYDAIGNASVNTNLAIFRLKFARTIKLVKLHNLLSKKCLQLKYFYQTYAF